MKKKDPSAGKPAQTFINKAFAAALERSSAAPVGERYATYLESLDRARRTIRRIRRTGRSPDEFLAQVERLKPSLREVAEASLFGSFQDLGLSANALRVRRGRIVAALNVTCATGGRGE